jgi:hypothetical protein
MKNAVYFIFSILEVPFILLSWVDYYWNLLWKTLSKLSIIFFLPSIVTMPITWINGFILCSIIYLKYNIIGVEMTYEDAINKNLSRFPEL